MNIKTTPRRLTLLLCSTIYFVITNEVVADDVDQRHGATLADSVKLDAGFTTTWQQAIGGQADGELLASLDLLAIRRAGQGIWTLYVEGSTSPRKQGVSAFIEEANADAGTALDHNDNGRLQVSELHYSQPLVGSHITLGLINPAGFIDSSALANDETSQFLAAPLVNNATLALPDYTLGATLHHEPSNSMPGLTLLLTSSHGLADNPKHSMSELVDINASGKGLFSALEAYWEKPSHLTAVGIWHSSARHSRLGKPGSESNHGLYALFEGQHDDTLWSLRAGLAKPDVSEASAFLAAAVEFPVHLIHDSAFGLGLAYTEASSKLADDSANSLHVETYLRHEVSENWHITPSLQWIQHPGLSKDPAGVDDPSLIASLRATLNF